MNMKIKIDKKKCLGCGVCAQFANKVFKVIGGKAKVKDEVKLEKYKKEIKEAEEVCPVGAIKVED